MVEEEEECGDEDFGRWLLLADGRLIPAFTFTE